MEEETIISKEMRLALLLIFSIFGIVYAYCSGVDSWEKLPHDTRKACIEYHYNRFLASRPVDPFYHSKYDTLIQHLFSTKLSFSENKAKLYTAYSLYGNYHLLVAHDYAEALAYFEAALKCEFSDPFMQSRKMLRTVMKSYVLYKLGRKKECFSAVKRVQDFLTSNEKNRDFQGKLYFKLLSLEYHKMLARLFAEEKQYKSAFNVLDKVENLKKTVPEDYSFDFIRAIIYQKKGDEKAWREELEKLELTGQNQDFYPYIFFNLLALYKKSGELERCILYTMKKLRDMEGDRDIKNILYHELGRLYDMAGKKEKALYYRKKSVPLTKGQKILLEHDPDFSF